MKTMQEVSGMTRQILEECDTRMICLVMKKK